MNKLTDKEIAIALYVFMAFIPNNFQPTPDGREILHDHEDIENFVRKHLIETHASATQKDMFSVMRKLYDSREDSSRVGAGGTNGVH